MLVLDQSGSVHFLTDHGQPKTLVTEISQLSAGPAGIAALSADGSLQTWATAGFTSPYNYLIDVEDPKIVSLDDGHAFVVTTAGDLVGVSGSRLTRYTVPEGEIVDIVHSQAFFSFLIYREGFIVPVGSDYAGQTTLPPAPSKPAKVIAFDNYAIVLRSDGSALAWGEYLPVGFGVNSYGDGPWFAQSSMPLGVGKIRDVATSAYFNILLMEDRSVIGWGSKRGGVFEIPSEAKNLRSVACGDRFVVGLSEGGKVHAWGDRRGGKCDVPEAMGKVTLISAGGRRAHALNEAGTVFSWGEPYVGSGQSEPKARPAELTQIAAISAGYGHALALRDDGSVVAWGDNSAGQCDVPADLPSCRAISAGAFVSVAIERETGKAIVWGDKDCQPPADLPPLVSVSAGHGVFIGTTAKNELVAWAAPRLNPAIATIPVGIFGLERD